MGWRENEASVAQWVLDRGQRAGAGSDTLSAAQGLYIPITGHSSTVGVLALKPSEKSFALAPDRIQLLETFASIIGGALESTRMSAEIGRRDAEAERKALSPNQAAASLHLRDLLSAERIVFFETMWIGMKSSVSCWEEFH